jgi:hypothetical protein
MVFYLAKLLQLIGFAHVTYALVVGMTEENAMGPELRLLMLGAVFFLGGRLLESRAAV